MRYIIITLFFFNTLLASPTDEIKINFNTITKDILNIVKDKTRKVNIREKEVIDIITPIFDFKSMARLSLGKLWKTLDKSTQTKFIDIYTKKTKQSYSSKLNNYSNERIVINYAKQLKPNRIILNTTLISSTDNMEVIYKYYKTKKKISNKNRWLIYDVIINNRSQVKSDKKQHYDYLKEHNILELIDSLKNKLNIDA